MPPEPAATERPPAEPFRSGRFLRHLWLAAGFACVALGVIGAFLPLMPTTIFIILAAGCFARSSPRLEAWLLAHPQFGPNLRAWRANGAIAPKAKALACTGMAGGYAVFWWATQPSPMLGAVVASVMLGCAVFVLTRPRPPEDI